MIEIEKRTPYDDYHDWVIKGTNKIHREDGPARIWSDGSEEWWINNELHRIDGPAIIYHMKLTRSTEYYWYIGGVELDRNTIKEWMHTNNYNWPFSKEIIVEFLLTFA